MKSVLPLGITSDAHWVAHHNAVLKPTPKSGIASLEGSINRELGRERDRIHGNSEGIGDRDRDWIGSTKCGIAKWGYPYMPVVLASLVTMPKSATCSAKKFMCPVPNCQLIITNESPSEDGTKMELIFILVHHPWLMLQASYAWMPPKAKQLCSKIFAAALWKIACFSVKRPLSYHH